MADEEIIIARTPPSDGRRWENQCARCGSSMLYECCTDCEDGYSHHDCGDDTCACLHPDNNVECETCQGEGGWRTCCSSAEWCNANPLPGRENVKRGEIEWFLVEEDE